MSRCVFCDRRIWPWQREGWRVRALDLEGRVQVVDRWHSGCARRVRILSYEAMLDYLANIRVYLAEPTNRREVMDAGCRFPIGASGEVCHVQPDAHTPEAISRYGLPPHEYVAATHPSEDLAAALRRACHDLHHSLWGGVDPTGHNVNADGTGAGDCYKCDRLAEALEASSHYRAALASAPYGGLDVERLARAICASRPPEEPADLADAMFIDDECRGIARRAVEIYARLREREA